MTRILNDRLFEDTFMNVISKGAFNEESSYYPRYKSRYKDLLHRYADIAPTEPVDVLDIGGGQLGLLCKIIWNDRSHVADIGGEHLDYLRSMNVSTSTWNLCNSDSNIKTSFDVIFFSEVIEHLPIPGHVVLEKLRLLLRPGGKLICSTPNLYRPRNIVYMILGKRIFDNFRMPTDAGLGHVIEYCHEHLAWQFKYAGFGDVSVNFVQMHHSPNNLFFRFLYFIGSPLFLFKRFRDNLVVVAEK